MDEINKDDSTSRVRYVRLPRKYVGTSNLRPKPGVYRVDKMRITICSNFTKVEPCEERAKTVRPRLPNGEPIYKKRMEKTPKQRRVAELKSSVDDAKNKLKGLAADMQASRDRIHAEFQRTNMEVEKALNLAKTDEERQQANEIRNGALARREADLSSVKQDHEQKGVQHTDVVKKARQELKALVSRKNPNGPVGRSCRLFWMTQGDRFWRNRGRGKGASSREWLSRLRLNNSILKNKRIHLHQIAHVILNAPVLLEREDADTLTMLVVYEFDKLLDKIEKKSAKGTIQRVTILAHIEHYPEEPRLGHWHVVLFVPDSTDEDQTLETASRVIEWWHNQWLGAHFRDDRPGYYVPIRDEHHLVSVLNYKDSYRKTETPDELRGDLGRRLRTRGLKYLPIGKLILYVDFEPGMQLISDLDAETGQKCPGDLRSREYFVPAEKTKELIFVSPQLPHPSGCSVRSSSSDRLTLKSPDTILENSKGVDHEDQASTVSSSAGCTSEPPPLRIRPFLVSWTWNSPWRRT